MSLHLEGYTSQVGQVLESADKTTSLLDSVVFLRNWPLSLLPKLKSLPPTHLPPFLDISFFRCFCSPNRSESNLTRIALSFRRWNMYLHPFQVNSDGTILGPNSSCLSQVLFAWIYWRDISYMSKHNPALKDDIWQSNYKASSPNMKGRKMEWIDSKPKIIFKFKLH